MIGLGEDGPAGLSEASRAALARAEIVFGAPRHLALVDARGRGCAWPVPFTIDPVLAERGRNVAVLASGDPFWHGAGGSLAAALEPHEWCCHPAPSTFSLAASRLGWSLQDVVCLGLHAAPFERLVPVLGSGQRLICLLRDGPAVPTLAAWLAGRGFGLSQLTVLEALGGPRERVRSVPAAKLDFDDVSAPVAVAIAAEGAPGLPKSPGLPDTLFASDGQITKSPVRALTLAALAPRPGEVLWDLGAGSGSIAVEWCLAAAGTRAHAVEARAGRIVNIRANAESFGIGHRLSAHQGDWPTLLATLPQAQAIFIGGGLNSHAIETILGFAGSGLRLVANAVTLETESLLAGLHARLGGRLLRIELAEAQPLGRMQGWAPARPVVQWSVEL